MLATGTEAVFPAGLHCRTVDEAWALDYSYKRNRKAYHGGIDMPAPFGTPIIAAADGVVVGKFAADNGKRGRELILRHSPADTGLLFWTYTGYGHFDKMPEWEIGQAVKKGQILGPTGNSGQAGLSKQQSTLRRPAIHFSVTYSKRAEFARTDRNVIPADGRWMDPITFYRQTPPFGSQAVKRLSSAEKQVAVPVKLDDGRYAPQDTKVIWPYECSERPQIQSRRNTGQAERARSGSNKRGGSGRCRDGNIEACRKGCNEGNDRACRFLKRLSR
jgi:murein DD-endopeptidase MepM/ murein hydrolase activator NlpD